MFGTSFRARSREISRSAVAGSPSSLSISRILIFLSATRSLGAPTTLARYTLPYVPSPTLAGRHTTNPYTHANNKVTNAHDVPSFSYLLLSGATTAIGRLIFRARECRVPKAEFLPLRTKLCEPYYTALMHAKTIHSKVTSYRQRHANHCEETPRRRQAKRKS